MDTRQYALSYFIKQGWTPSQAAGIVGNLMQESSLRPTAYNPKDPGGSVGLGQWNGDRKRAFYQFAGNNAGDLDTQLAFVQHELQTSEQGVANRLVKTTTPQDAAAAFVGYERPQGWTLQNPTAANGWQNRLNNTLALAGLPVSTLANNSHADMIQGGDTQIAQGNPVGILSKVVPTADTSQPKTIGEYLGKQGLIDRATQFAARRGETAPSAYNPGEGLSRGAAVDLALARQYTQSGQGVSKTLNADTTMQQPVNTQQTMQSAAFNNPNMQGRPGAPMNNVNLADNNVNNTALKGPSYFGAIPNFQGSQPSNVAGLLQQNIMDPLKRNQLFSMIGKMLGFT